MTRNQTRSIDLARQLVLGAIDPTVLPDDDWNLLLLAAGLNNFRTQPMVVAHNVLQQATKRHGYFFMPHEQIAQMATAS